MDGNEISGTVHGPSVQAGFIRGDVHLHSGQHELVGVYAELNRVRQQLIESMQAERNITNLVWVLQTVLMRLQDTIVRLTWERDQRVVELEQARSSQARTERQLERAEAERADAMRLVEVARAKVLVLEAGLRGAALPASPEVELTQIDVGLDMVDQYLDEQGQRLADLSAELEPTKLKRDELTGLLSRSSAVRVLDRLLAEDPSKVAVLYCDVDNFKRINDSLGHIVGDSVLADLARSMENELPDGCVAARMSGDEFLVICPDIDVAGGVGTIATRVATLLRRLVTVVGGQSVRVTATVGAAVADRPGVTGSDLIRFADSAMYAAKRRGPGRVSVASRELIEAIDRQVDLEVQLRHAIAHDGLDLDFQGVFDRDHRVLFAEALVRWPHSRLGRLMPHVILPVAELGGMMRELDTWVLRAALAEAATGPFSVSVNLSGLLPGDPDFVDIVTEVVEDVGIPWDHVVLELVESSLVDSTTRARVAMDTLRERGLRFAIDGFGTGYSSLARLRDLPVQIIKIDRRFVADVEHDQSLLQAVADMARAKGCLCVAVGVETRAQYFIASTTGVDAFQGWLLDRPAPRGRPLPSAPH